jgi:hypothetical protein
MAYDSNDSSFWNSFIQAPKAATNAFVPAAPPSVSSYMATPAHSVTSYNSPSAISSVVNTPSAPPQSSGISSYMATPTPSVTSYNTPNAISSILNNPSSNSYSVPSSPPTGGNGITGTAGSASNSNTGSNVGSNNQQLPPPIQNLDWKQKAVKDWSPQDLDNAKIFFGANMAKIDPYNSKYNDERTNQFTSLMKAISSFNESYDVNADPAYQIAVDNMTKQMVRQFAKRGMAYSDSAKGAISQKAAELALKFEEKEIQKRRDNINNLGKGLELVSGFETDDYNRYRDMVNDTTNQNNTNYDRNVDLFKGLFDFQKGNYDFTQKQDKDFYDMNRNKIEDNKSDIEFTRKQEEWNKQDEEKTKKDELTLYGTYLTPQIRQQKQTFESMPANVRQQVQQYSGDYAAEINKRAAQFPDDPLIPYLMAARTAKILSNPTLLAQHGASIGLSNPLIATNAQTYQSTEFKTYVEKIKAQFALPQSKADLDKAVSLAEEGKWKAAKAQIEALAAPEQVKAELMLKLEQVETQKSQQSQNYAGAAYSQAGTALRGEQINTEKAQQGKIYADTAKTQKESFDYKGLDQYDKYIQDTFMSKSTSNQSVTGLDEKGNETGVKTNTTSVKNTMTTKDREDITAYILGLKANPNVDQDIVTALMSKYSVNIK